MNITCDVIRDLLPLCAENVASPDSNALVEEHMRTCRQCREAYEKMKTIPPVPAKTDAGSLKRVEKEIRCRRWRAALLAFFATASVLVGAFLFVTTPEYLSAEEAIESVTTTEEGCVCIQFSEAVQGYHYEVIEPPEGSSPEAVIYAWRYWLPVAMSAENSVLNMTVERLWYGSTDMAREDTLLWGEPRNGGVTSLPRLVLGYYFLIALGLGAVLTILALLLKRRKAGRVMTMGAALCWCFAFSSLFVTQGNFQTYQTQRYFLSALILTLLLFGTLYEGTAVWKQYRQDKGQS